MEWCQVVRANPERRQALLDASIEVLARDAPGGLTFRAVDKEARVPAGDRLELLPPQPRRAARPGGGTATTSD